MMENYGTTSEMNLNKFSKAMNLINFATENIMVKYPILSKFNFEILKNNDEENLELIKVHDFFNNEQVDTHLLSASVDFRASFGARTIPSKALNWDGRILTAEEFRRSRTEDRGDCYLIKMPSGELIGQQVKSEGIFDHSGDFIYSIHPREINDNNWNAHYRLIPNRVEQGRRLILL